jgi:hypothetical protein
MSKIKLSKKLGIILLGIWLILNNLLPLVNINIPDFGIIMGILAIASGVLILLDQ